MKELCCQYRKYSILHLCLLEHRILVPISSIYSEIGLVPAAAFFPSGNKRMQDILLPGCPDAGQSCIPAFKNSGCCYFP